MEIKKCPADDGGAAVFDLLAGEIGRDDTPGNLDNQPPRLSTYVVTGNLQVEGCRYE